MTCKVYDCKHNNGNGCCENGSYVTINNKGECDDMLVIEQSKGEAE